MGRPGQILFASLVLLLGVGVLAIEEEVINLRPFKVRKDQVTISGFSSGSAMATTLHMAHSSLFSGVALFSMAYYRCGNGNLIEFGLGCCTWLQERFPIPDIFPRYNISRAVADAKKYASHGWIDPLEGLANQKVFIWSGTRDTGLPIDVVKQNYDFYRNFIPNTQNIKLTTHEANHDFPTDNSTVTRPCSEPETDGKDTHPSGVFADGPKFVNCNYSGAYEMMKFMIGDEIVKPDANLQIGELQFFNQTEFYYGTNVSHVSMREVGWIYIPEYCRDGTNECLLHFHFHGCGESDPYPARNTFQTAGFLHVAEANNIIMVFPLTLITRASINGCWDFFGYTGPDYATQKGVQVKMLYRMLDRLLEISNNPNPEPSRAILSTSHVLIVGASSILVVINLIRH